MLGFVNIWMEKNNFFNFSEDFLGLLETKSGFINRDNIYKNLLKYCKKSFIIILYYLLY